MFTDCGEILLSTFSLNWYEPSLAWLVLVCETQSPMKVAFFQSFQRSRVILGEIDTAFCTVPVEKSFLLTLLRTSPPQALPCTHRLRASGHQETQFYLLQDHPRCWGFSAENKPWALGVYTPFPSFPGLQEDFSYSLLWATLTSHSTSPPQGCQLQAPMAKCSGHMSDCCPLAPKLFELNYGRTCPLGTVTQVTRIQKQWQGKMEGLGRKMQSWIG